MPLEQQKVAEILFRSKAEPKLSTLYVEGSSDSEIVRWLLRTQNSSSQTSVHRIDLVDIPAAMLQGQENNNRGRLIAMAVAFGPSLLQNLHCLVDADFHHVSPDLPDTHGLHTTDFSAMELYLYNDEVLDKFLGLVCQSNVSVAQFKGDLESALGQLFVFRLACRKLDWRARILAPDDDLVYKGGRVTFDAVDYTTRILTVNRRARERATFEEACSALAIEHHDVRVRMHGHDFIDYLAWYAHEAVRQLHNGEAVKRMLVGFGHVDHYRRHGRMRTLLSKLR